MQRREFITLLGGAAAWPLAARAQQPERIRRVGVLTPKPDLVDRNDVAAFTNEFQRLGWEEGRNFHLEYRAVRSEEHTSELQSLRHLVCRLLLEKKKKQDQITSIATNLCP